jgi:hypothetical protein
MKWKFMKNVWIYHLIVDTPAIIFVMYWVDAGLPGVDLIIFGIVYPFIFRPIMDYYRLKAVGEIDQDDFWKMWKWGGLYRFKYYSTLMFGK